MNLRDLEYINAIYRLKSLAKAASVCHVSQSTLSIQLKKLETHLGVKLFERSKAGVFPTEIGKSVLQISNQIEMQAKEIEQISKDAEDPFAGELKFGAFPTLAPYWFPKIVPLIKKNFPKIRLQLFEDKTELLIGKLANGELDCAALALPVARDEFKFKSLFKEVFFLAVNSKNKLASAGKKSASINDIKHERLLLLEEGHCMRGQALSFCTKLGINEADDYRAASLETLRNMVVAGEGITLIPHIAIEKDDRRIKYLKFSAAEPEREIGLFWRKQSSREILFKELVPLLKRNVDGNS